MLELVTELELEPELELDLVHGEKERHMGYYIHMDKGRKEWAKRERVASVHDPDPDHDHVHVLLEQEEVALLCSMKLRVQRH